MSNLLTQICFIPSQLTASGFDPCFSALNAADWRRLGLPSVIEDAIRSEVSGANAASAASSSASSSSTASRGMQLVKKQPAKVVAPVAVRKPVAVPVTELVDDDLGLGLDDGWGDLDIDQPAASSSPIAAAKPRVSPPPPAPSAKPSSSASSSVKASPAPEKDKKKKTVVAAAATDNDSWGDDDLMDLKF
jgi:hypothetical protein